MNCRRRKKGCDFRKPICGRCHRLGIKCAYELRQFTFVNETGPSYGPTFPANDSLSGPVVSSPRSALQNSLLATNLDLQVDAGFWSVYLPHEDPALNGSIDGVRAASWLPTVRALAEESSAVRTSIQAIAYTGFGWAREDSALVQHGLRLYTEALRATNQMLQDHELALSDPALACCRTLSLFEMFRRGPGIPEIGQNQNMAWRGHAEGTFRLVQLRGPSSHVSENGYNLYDGVRMTGIIHGIARRQPNGFTSLSWDLPRRKNLRDDLFDSMSRVPSLLQQIDILNAQSSGINIDQQIVKDGEVVLTQTLSVCSFLKDWEVRALELCNRQKGAKHEEQLIDVCYSHGYAFFFLCAQYWTMCVKVYSAVHLLQRQTLEVAKNFRFEIELPDIPNWINPDPAANKIANVASHFFRPEAGLWSAQSAIFPIGTALLYFAHTGRADSDGVQRMLHAFSETKSGAIMRDFLESTGMYVKRDKIPSS